jgi:hypothetical protein
MTEPIRLPFVVDLALGLASEAVGRATAVGRGVGRLADPAVRVVIAPGFVAPRLRPVTWLDRLARHGAVRRVELENRVADLLDVVVPAVVVELVRRLDLAVLVREYIDVDALLQEVDLDAVAGRLDVDAVVARVDIAAVLHRLDLNEIVREGVDLDGLVGSVDIDAAAARLDLDAVIGRLDLVGLVQRVLAEIDLPEIIRESTGAVASDTVRGVRMQTISADDAIGRAVDRLRLRRAKGVGPTTTAGPAPPDGAP